MFIVKLLNLEISILSMLFYFISKHKNFQIFGPLFKKNLHNNVRIFWSQNLFFKSFSHENIQVIRVLTFPDIIFKSFEVRKFSVFRDSQAPRVYFQNDFTWKSSFLPSLQIFSLFLRRIKMKISKFFFFSRLSMFIFKLYSLETCGLSKFFSLYSNHF